VGKIFLYGKKAGYLFKRRFFVNNVLFDQQITFIYVKDLAVSQEFYEDVMGFPLMLDQGTCRIVTTCQSGGGGYLGYCKSKEADGDRSCLILTLVTPLVDEWYVYLKERGVPLLNPPRINPQYDIYQFFLKDPDGYTIEIQSFLDSRWEKVQ
jgi:catechol 2,3-dioxygenase-like lactoylglutathione lyase family enzyme